MNEGDDRIIGRVFWWSIGVIAVIAIVVIGVLLLRPEPKGEEIIERPPIVRPAPEVVERRLPPAVTFTDATEAAGIEFVHENGARGEKLLPETMGGGVAFFDPDGDGDEDLLLVGATTWSTPETGRPSSLSFYLNDGSGRFTDATGAWGLETSLYGMGVACGDSDGDGDTDLYITAFGKNRLFENQGGRFRDATARAGVAGSADAWSTSAGFFDMDADGDLDLFVCNYVEWTRAIDLALHFTLNGTDRAYGPPLQYRGSHSRLYENQGDGTFKDISRAAGIEVENRSTGEPVGKALALTFVDVNDDGRLDIAVANDTVRNFLFLNQGDGTFHEAGAEFGVAYDETGAATGAMGIDAADVMNDGSLALAVANFANENTSVYVRAPGRRSFAELSSATGIGGPSRRYLSFGLVFFDYDLDGWIDLLQANGHLEAEITTVQPAQSYRQRAQLFWNAGTTTGRRFVDVDPSKLGALAVPRVARGTSAADIDGDGDLDLVIMQSGDSAVLVRNDQQLDHHWVGLRLIGVEGAREAIGARIDLTAGGRTQRRWIMPTRSYLAQLPLLATFGLGTGDAVEHVSIRWPDGSEQQISAGIISLDRVTTVRRVP